MNNGLQESTRLIHGGKACGDLPRTPAPVVQRGSTVLLTHGDHAYDPARLTYGRAGLATHRVLRSALRDLEHGDEAFLYPSGLSAITGTLTALLRAGDEVLFCDSVYNPTRCFLRGTMARFGVTARSFPSNAGVDDIRLMLTPATRLIVMESPGSNTLDMQDIPAIARMARENDVFTLVDNTWAAGVLFKPLDHGVDVSVQSLTKYVCGHSDVFMGAAIARGKATALLARSSKEVGWAVSPDDAYMALRGMRTLHARLSQHGVAATKIASWLATQPEVLRLLCPALPQDPGHDIWKAHFSGYNGLFAIVLDPMAKDSMQAMLDGLSVFGIGFSWGGFESLALPCDPQLTLREHFELLPGPLLRIHVGLEAADDLIADLRRGLDRIHAKQRVTAFAEK